MRPTRPRSASAPPGGRRPSAPEPAQEAAAPLARPALAAQGAIAEPVPRTQAEPALEPLPAPPAQDWRSRHPVLAVSLSSAVRDALGQGTGRALGAAVLAGIETALHHPDPALHEFRERMLAFAGGGVAMLASGVAGAYTGNMLSLTVHRRDASAERRSPLWMVGLAPPVLLTGGLMADALMGGRAGLALGAGQALSRVVQYLGRDAAGQAYTAAMQYRRHGHAPGFRLRVLQADGRPLADADPAGFNRFTLGRLKTASVIYALLCVACFTLGLWMQTHWFQSEAGDHSYGACLRGSLGMVLATVVLEALDGVNGVVAHQIQARRQGLRLELNEEETQVDNLPEFVMTHALARTATNGLQDLAGALDRGLSAGAEFSPAWFAVRVLPRTLAQVLTEPRGFIANTSIEVRQAQARAALARFDAQVQDEFGPAPALAPARIPAPVRAAGPVPEPAPAAIAAQAPRVEVLAVPRRAWGPASPEDAVVGVDDSPPHSRQPRPASLTEGSTTASSTGTPASRLMRMAVTRPPSALAALRPHSAAGAAGDRSATTGQGSPGQPDPPTPEQKHR